MWLWWFLWILLGLYVQFAAMGMCAVKGPRVLGEDEHVDHDDGEFSPRSTMSTTSGSSGYGSASSQELDEAEASDRFSFSDGALWQRTIPKGRRCKPLSFTGMIVYDANGRQVANVTLPLVDAEDDDDDEYFSSQPRNLAESEEFLSPHAVE